MKSPVRYLLPTTYFLQPNLGFSLIEIVVTIAIIGILTTMVAAGYPAVRNRHTMQRAQQQMELLLREAQQQTLNEERAKACRDLSPRDTEGDIVARRRCSDVGIHLQGTTAILFADLNSDKAYSANRDYQIRDPETLPATVVPNQTIVFNATPPHLTMYGNGGIVDGQHPLEVTFQLHNDTSTLLLRPFGKIEQKQE